MDHQYYFNCNSGGVVAGDSIRFIYVAFADQFIPGNYWAFSKGNYDIIHAPFTSFELRLNLFCYKWDYPLYCLWIDSGIQHRFILGGFTGLFTDKYGGYSD